ncbi:hypothetical protein H6F42_21325 [Pseudanabaena sp. FACHB-1998]|uniref:hypothetical protein n=1 Tax=Pseudanabaena sp. FACHB-1998 TaxID=2692858 RepID=UPI00168001CF|nr:hypothetical protein [Pseudanabaena sp. FACHB-1998]MBD2179457.1 hypothetical protein [Pseudanabaena sp. FACHB-1998]
MTTKRYKSVLCGLLLLAIAIHPEQHHVVEKHPKIVHIQTRRQRKYWRKKQKRISA